MLRNSILLFLSALIAVKSNQVGDEICYEGLVVDSFCLNVGFFPHSTVRTLQDPASHTVHCMIDDVPCILSGYEMLKLAEEGEQRTSPYCRAYKLDKSGNQKMVHLAKSTGVCDDCYANTTGEWVKGLRVTVLGTVALAGDENSPAVLNVTDVLESSVGCEVQAQPEHCIYEVPGLTADDSPCHTENEGKGDCRNLNKTATNPTLASNPTSAGFNYLSVHPTDLVLSVLVSLAHVCFN